MNDEFERVMKETIETTMSLSRLQAKLVKINITSLLEEGFSREEALELVRFMNVNVTVEKRY